MMKYPLAFLTEAAFQELDALNHTEQAIEGVRPPVGLPR